jgi:hypothetical protein
MIPIMVADIMVVKSSAVKNVIMTVVAEDIDNDNT